MTTAMTPVLAKLLSNLDAQEQWELERFATSLLLRRRITTEQIVSDELLPPSWHNGQCMEAGLTGLPMNRTCIPKLTGRRPFGIDEP